MTRRGFWIWFTLFRMDETKEWIFSCFFMTKRASEMKIYFQFRASAGHIKFMEWIWILYVSNPPKVWNDFLFCVLAFCVFTLNIRNANVEGLHCFSYVRLRDIWTYQFVINTDCFLASNPATGSMRNALSIQLSKFTPYAYRPVSV